MKIIKCKVCGSTDVTTIIEANPNDHTSFANLCRQDCAIGELYCNKCDDYVGPDTDEVGDIRQCETDQFKLWQQGLVDMFVVWYGDFRRSDQTLIAFGHEIFYAAHRAEAWLEDYINKRNLTSDREVSHSFAIRYFNPKVEVRAKLFPKPEMIFSKDVNLYPAVWERNIK